MCCSMLQCFLVCCNCVTRRRRRRHMRNILRVLMYVRVRDISHMCAHILSPAPPSPPPPLTPIGWLRLVGLSKLQVSFAEYSLFYRALLQKRPIILRSLLIVATPYRVAKTHRMPQVQVIFRKRATNYRALLRKMTQKDKAFYDSMPPCTTAAYPRVSCHTLSHVEIYTQHITHSQNFCLRVCDMLCVYF